MLSLDHVACPSMNHHTSSRQRKKGSSNDKMKKQQRGRNCSTLSSIPVCLPFNIVGKLILLIGMGLLIPSAIRSLRCLPDLVITNMEEGLAVLPEVQIGTLQVQTRVGGIAKIVGPKSEPTVVGHTHRKGGWDHHMLGVVCLLQVKEEVLVVMELALQITPKVVSLEAPLVVELQTLWAVIEINSMVGSNDN